MTSPKSQGQPEVPVLEWMCSLTLKVMGERSLEKDDIILLQEIKANVDKDLRKIKCDWESTWLTNKEN